MPKENYDKEENYDRKKNIMRQENYDRNKKIMTERRTFGQKEEN